MRYVLDSNHWIRLLRRSAKLRRRFEEALSRGDEIIVTPIAYFEVMRGLRKRNDWESIAFLKQLWEDLECALAGRAVWREAVNLWVDTARKNELREDADVLIAAFARVLGARIVTQSVRHLNSFGLQVENWLTSEPTPKRPAEDRPRP